MSDENIIRSLADGALNLGDTKIDVAVLEDGARIITHSGVFRALGREPRGNARLDKSLHLWMQKTCKAWLMRTCKAWSKDMWERFNKIKSRNETQSIEFDEKGRLKDDSRWIKGVL